MRERRLPSEKESQIQWWRQVIVRQQSAGVSVVQFCRELGMTPRKFRYWVTARRNHTPRAAAGCGPRRQLAA
jgi:transposase-like protein